MDISNKKENGEHNPLHPSTEINAKLESTSNHDVGEVCHFTSDVRIDCKSQHEIVKDVFDETLRMLQPISDDLMAIASIAEKLVLYGLYKHIKYGPCEVEKPSRWRIEAHAKHQAWKNNRDMTKQSAMLQYVDAAVNILHNHSIHEDVAKKCRLLLIRYNDSAVDFANPEKPERQCYTGLSKDVAPMELFEHDLRPSVCSRFRDLVYRLTGVSPVVPRGQLDISYQDLAFAFMKCLTVRDGQIRSIEDKIAKHWKESLNQKDDTEVITGLSARTLLDLYLRVQRYPHGSEIIMCPPINVPGILQVLQYHKINVIGVDIPESKGVEIVVGVDVDQIERAITAKSVAIMIVHPFGIVSTTNDDMKRIRSIADSQKNKLHVLEDCAECFTGLSKSLSYTGSPYTDVAFFSFGLIKTATAIGGGIAIIRGSPMIDLDAGNCIVTPNDLDKKILFDSMMRMHSLHYHVQSNYEFFFKAMKCFLLRFIADHPFLYGLIRDFFSKSIGIVNFESFVSWSVSGFCKREDRDLHRKMFEIRRRPSPALLSLLYRRLLQTSVAISVEQRIRRCSNLSRLITDRTKSYYQLPVPKDGLPHFYWLYPILSHDPSLLSRKLQVAGFDATRGLSQLLCVPPIDGREYPRAQSLMDRITYLPVAGSTLSEISTQQLAKLLIAESCSSTSKHRSRKIPCRQWYTLLAFYMVALIFCTSSLSYFLLEDPIMYMLNVLLLIFNVLALTSVCAIFALCVVRAHVGIFYVKSSTAFAEFIDSIETKKDADQTSILSSMDMVQICDAAQFRESKPRSVLLTGCTGFVGSMVLHDLLKHRKVLGVDRVIVLCRQKKGRCPKDRVFDFLNGSIFSFLSQNVKDNLVEVIDGDVALENIGISEQDITHLCQNRVISHLIHCAASVSFSQTLPEAAKANISSALHVQQFISRLNCNQDLSKTVLIHVSTAFVHGGSTGTKMEPLREELYSLGPYDPLKVYESMITTQFYASKVMVDLGFPNTYTFSKCVCEHLLVKNCGPNQTIIIRPSIVGPAIENPYDGWAGRTPSTVVATACLYFVSQWNLWSFTNNRAPIIPVDVLSRYILAKCFHNNASEHRSTFSRVLSDKDDYQKTSSPSTKDSAPELRKEKAVFNIYNAAWDTDSPLTSSFTWYDFAICTLQVGSIKGHFGRLTAYFGLFLSCWMLPYFNLNLRSFEAIHSMLVLLPFRIASRVGTYFGRDSSQLKRLHQYLDLPLLFYPFMQNCYHFRSDLTAPVLLVGKQYVLTCVMSANMFVTNSNLLTTKQEVGVDTNLHQYPVAGSAVNVDRSMTWVLTQPRGFFLARVAAWCLSHLFFVCFSEVTVDIPSFSESLRMIKKYEGPKCIVLAPTHRSLFDFLLLSYVFFCIPELQIEVPFIVAADDFERLPLFGLLARFLKAFFISREKSKFDPLLADKLQTLSQQAEGNEFYVEVFIEGKRSRDRRFECPKTGILRCLHKQERRMIIIPIAISYERLPEQEILVAETEGSRSRGFNIFSLVWWLQAAFRKNSKLSGGRAHLAACSPIGIESTIQPNWKSIADEVQCRQQERLLVSTYHLAAAAKLLKLELAIVSKAFQQMRVPMWHCNDDIIECRKMPNNQSELFTLLLQASPYVAALIKTSHPNWARWLSRHECRRMAPMESLDSSLSAVSQALAIIFDEADSCIDLCRSKLHENGFIHPTSDHVLQTARKLNSRVPLLLLAASVSMKMPSPQTSNSDNSKACVPRPCYKQQLQSGEALGWWGFHDSLLVLRVDKRGKMFLAMEGEGSRYNLAGKKITNLIPFMETEMEIVIDPLSEWFPSSERISCSSSQLSKNDIDFLKSQVSFLSVCERERVRHGTGHCLEDIMCIRQNVTLRVPDAVVWPASEKEVESLVQCSKEKDWCILPFGGGTNVSQATRCPSADVEARPIIAVDMTKMNRVLAIDEENGVALVEAGITGTLLEKELGIRGFTIGHQPDSMEFSTLGGWIATKASGMKRNKYGNIEDIVVSLRVVSTKGVLQHGEVGSAWGRESVGIDLRGLFLGSEGCLGIITTAVVRIMPVAESKSYDSVLFSSFEEGLQFLFHLSRVKSKLPASVRLLDNPHFRLGVALKPDSSGLAFWFKQLMFHLSLGSRGRAFDRQAVVCATIAYEGTKDEVAEQILHVSKLSRRFGGIRIGSDTGKSGYDLTFLVAYLRDFAMTYHILGESFETFVPWSKVGIVIQATKNRIHKEHSARYLPGRPFIGSRITQLYHEGVCLYFYFCMNFFNVENASTVFKEIEHAARSEILSHGGSLSHHHGVGKLRSSYLKQIESEALLESMKSLKQSLDPENVFGLRNGAFATSDNDCSGKDKVKKNA